MIRRAGRWAIDCAPDETRRFYGARPTGDAERCGCLYCRNFAEARDVVYSESLQAQLAELGVDFRKEDGSGEARLLPSGLRVYLPWFTFVGRVVEVAPEDGGDEFWIGPAVDRTLDDMGERARLLQLDLSLEVPWVILDEEPNF